MVYLLNNKPQMINLNIGTGIGTSVLELVKIFEKVNKCTIPIEFTKRRKGDVSSSVANISFALKVLDWCPNRSIEDACLDGWKWQSPPAEKDDSEIDGIIKFGNFLLSCISFVCLLLLVGAAIVVLIAVSG